MPFWIHRSLLIHKIYTTPLTLKISLFLLSFSLIIGSYYIFIHEPQGQHIQQLQSQCLSLKTTSQNLSKTANTYTTVATQNNAVKDRVALLTNQSQNPQKGMSFLLQLMNEHHISCRSLQPSKISQRDFYNKNYLTLTGSGSFTDILKFLDAIKQSESLTSIKHIKLSRGRHHTVRITMTMRAVNLKEKA